MKTHEKDYKKVFDLSKHARILQGVSSLLDWDQETYMPQGAEKIRAEQQKAMAGIIHREKTSKKFAKALSKLIDLNSGQLKTENLLPEQAAAIREWRRDYFHDTALPSKFVEEFAKATSQSINAWRLAREENSFQKFAPFLDKIIQLCRKKADLIGYKDHPYDALLDLYEPGINTADLSTLFSDLQFHLTPLIKKISQIPVDNQFLHGKWEEKNRWNSLIKS